MLQQLTMQNFNEVLSRFTTAELESLLARTPYFQQAHLLLAKKYQLEHNPKFDEQLQMAALYTNDRELFYTIFNQAVPAINTQQRVIEAVEEEALGKVSATETPAAKVAEVEGEYIDNIVIEENLEEPADAHVELHAEETEEPEVQQEEQEQRVALSQPHTFDEWISVFKKNKQQPLIQSKAQPEQPVEDETEMEPEVMDDELDKMIMTSVSANYLQELVNDEKHYSKGLDVFIAEQIKRKRGGETRSPGTENEMSPDLATETLAKLYENQKKYAKAIKAYEALSLKFPEKNGLFAARINYLKKLI